MTEQDIRRIVLDAVPPLPAPPDRLAAVVRRARKQRLQAVSVTAALGVTLLAAVAGTLATGGAGSTPQVVTASGSASAAPTATPDPTPSVPDGSPSPPASPPPSPQDPLARLNTDAGRVLRRAVPGVQPAGPFDFIGSGGFGEEYGSLQVVTANGRRGTVWLMIRRGTGEESCATEFGGPAANCTESTGPNGEKILSVPVTGDGGSGGKPNRALFVMVARKDGTTVLVLSDNATRITARPTMFEYNMEVTDHTGGLPVLTLAQVRTMALDARLTPPE